MFETCTLQNSLYSGELAMSHIVEIGQDILQGSRFKKNLHEKKIHVFSLLMLQVRCMWDMPDSADSVSSVSNALWPYWYTPSLKRLLPVLLQNWVYPFTFVYENKATSDASWLLF